MKKRIGFILVLVLSVAAILYIAFSNRESGKYVFGSLLPLSGQTANYGEMMKRGQLMAAEDIKKQYGDSVKIVFFNTEHQKDIALSKLMEASNRNIKHIIEIFGSDQVDHCLKYSIDNDLFILSGVDTKTALVSQGDSHFFRIMPSDAAATQEIFKWMTDSGTKKIAIVYVNDDWGEGLLNSALDNIYSSSLSLVGKFDINRHQQSFSATIAKIKETAPEALCLFIYPDDGGRFIKEAHRQGLMPTFYATENFTGEDMTKTAQSASEGVRLVIPASATLNEKMNNFSAQYYSRFNEEPTIFSSKGYDAVWIMYDLIKAKGKRTEDLVNCIKSGYYFDGITGKLSFDENGEFIPDKYERMKYVWQEGQAKLVKIR